MPVQFFREYMVEFIFTPEGQDEPTWRWGWRSGQIRMVPHHSGIGDVWPEPPFVTYPDMCGKIVNAALFDCYVKVGDTLGTIIGRTFRQTTRESEVRWH